MSNVTPASFKAGPITTNTLASKKYVIFHFIILWLSLIPDFFLITHFFYRFEENYYWILIMFPLQLGLWYLIFVMCAIIWSWLFFKIVNFIHRPTEGYFHRDPKDPDFRYWSLRAVIKKLPLWLSHNFPFPWLDILVFKLFGNNVPITTSLFDAWVDAEFLEIDKKTTIGQGSVIMSSMITPELLIIKRVRIGKNCVIGSHSVISPGTVIGDNVILGAFSCTAVDQVLESNWVYTGNPAQKYRENIFREHDNLTAEQRAMKKGYLDIIKELPEGPEVHDRKIDKLIRKSAEKQQAAEKSVGKAKYYITRSEFGHLRERLRAEKFEIRAEKRRFESDEAIEKAKQLIMKKREDTKKKEEKKAKETKKETDPLDMKVKE